MDIREVYNRAADCIRRYGGKPPEPSEAGSIELIADFCYAINVVPHITLVDRDQREVQQLTTE